ncbi:hypothetical protein C8Q69DRAFT_449005 [Paecilomyces variotii]|uniref:Uncharacterized protein n=1 Tax=Byssochlamys spectabilis TaxID=264951 RepID=A0A443I4A7_BYSSP|nr:hypothetical protein C8Q69DRAFT_449005 [Paecilomyces variotii]RWQ98867.1 hypothetical protein C8Q69DRAFT_449005 [Paecilomyces variotii]
MRGLQRLWMVRWIMSQLGQQFSSLLFFFFLETFLFICTGMWIALISDDVRKCRSTHQWRHAFQRWSLYPGMDTDFAGVDVLG